jgi:chaperonin GroES
MVPLFSNVLVRKPQAVTKTAGGIVLPETAKQKLNWGTVLEVGPGRIDKAGSVTPLQVKKGKRMSAFCVLVVFVFFGGFFFF